MYTFFQFMCNTNEFFMLKGYPKYDKSVIFSPSCHSKTYFLQWNTHTHTHTYIWKNVSVFSVSSIQHCWLIVWTKKVQNVIDLEGHQFFFGPYMCLFDIFSECRECFHKNETESAISMTFQWVGLFFPPVLCYFYWKGKPSQPVTKVA